MAFRNMNRKRHIGLQQLSSLASIGRTLLGPVKLSKFIVDESTCGSMLVCSAVKLLENLDLSSAVGQLLNEAVQAQNNEYKTGTTTLLFLVGAWSNAVLECLQQDIPFSVIVTVMSESLDSCIERVQCLAISIDNMLQKLDCVPVEVNDKAPINTSSGSFGRQISETQTTDIKSNNSPLNSLEHLYLQASEEKSAVLSVNKANTCNSWEESMYPSVLSSSNTAYSLAKSVNASYVCRVSKNNLGRSSHNKRLNLSHSRYFGSARENHSQQKTEHWEETGIYSDGLSDLRQLAMSLSHGNWSCMKLVQNILKFQVQTSRNMADTYPFQFNISEIVTCCLPGMSESHSCVYPGYITLIHSDKAAVAKQLQDRPLCFILVDGDLTETYHHLGFNRSHNVRMVLEGVTVQDSSSRLWVDTMLDILIQSKINLILVQGNACENLEKKCLLNNIVIISQVTHRVLKAFSDITQAERVTYLNQVNEHCIGEGVSLKLLGTLELSWVELDDRVPVAITVNGIHLTTAVLSCPVISKVTATEDQFWTCAYRVHHALLDHAVFPGGGTVEFLCLSYLENLEKAATNRTGESCAGPSWLAKSLEQYKPLVRDALGYAWHQYLCTVMCKTANCVSELEASTLIQQHLRKAAMCGSPLSYIMDEFRKENIGVANFEHIGVHEKALRVYDNVTAKVEAWRRALDLVLLVLQTDAEIITGPKRDQLLKSKSSNEFIFL